jgi:hypothetical protein
VADSGSSRHGEGGFVAQSYDQDVNGASDEDAERGRAVYTAVMERQKDLRSLLDSIRSRAVTLLAVAVALGAFLGERILDAAAEKALTSIWGPISSKAAVAIAVAAFLAVMSAVIYTWLPLRGKLDIKPETLIKYLIRCRGPSLGEAYYELATEIDRAVEEADTRIHRRQVALAIAMGALGLALVCMLITLWDLLG